MYAVAKAREHASLGKPDLLMAVSEGQRMLTPNLTLSAIAGGFLARMADQAYIVACHSICCALQLCDIFSRLSPSSAEVQQRLAYQLSMMTHHLMCHVS